MQIPPIKIWPFVILAILYFCSIVVDTMDVDASQYAYLSKEMLQSGSYLQVYEHGNPYLDKPPLLFWITAQSMRLFGFTNLGFKFPSIVLALWSLYATYRFTRLLYAENTARLAALVLGCSQAMFLMTNDIRTDTMLMSWVITAIWFWKEWDLSQKKYWLFAAFAAMALGMMTKGPIGFIAPVVVMGADWILRGKWKRIFNSNHLLALLVMGSLLIPMTYGLYHQFDLQPNQVVNGKTNVSGVRFFYWTQSFGRITGENVWDNKAPFSFLFENMLWAFLPWTLLFIVAWLSSAVSFIKACVKKQLALREWHTFLGFTLVYVMLAMSRYQLPHYLFVVYPLAAVLTAALIERILKSNSRLTNQTAAAQFIICALLLVTGLAIVWFVFPANKWLGSLYLGFAILGFVLLFFKKNSAVKLVWGSAYAAIAINVLLTFGFYQPLLAYQGSSTLAREINKIVPLSDTVRVRVNMAFHATYFYAHTHIEKLHTLEEMKKYKWLLVDTEHKNQLRNQVDIFTVRAQQPNFKVSELKPDFLNYKKRYKVLDTLYLLQKK